MKIIAGVTISIIFILAIVYLMRRKAVNRNDTVVKFNADSTVQYSFNLLEDENKMEQESAAAFINKLAALGYYKYAAEKDIEAIKENMHFNFRYQQDISTLLFGDDDSIPADYRCYQYDFHSLNIGEILSFFKPVFNKMNFNLKVNKIFRDDKSLKLQVVLNNAAYTLCTGNVDYGWDVFPSHIANMLNAELARQHCEDRIYLSGGSRKGRFLILNPDLFNYMNTMYTNWQIRPYTTEDWQVITKNYPVRLD